MNRHFRGVRQYQHAVRHSTWLRIDTKKLALASAVTAVTISGGVALLTNSGPNPTPTKQQTESPSQNTTSSHPLLGLSDISTPLPGLEEASPRQSSAQNSEIDALANGVMHQTAVTINGESIEIPPAGSSHQTIRNQDGSQTEVDIQHDQTQVDGTPRSNINIDSRTKSSGSTASLNSRITITH